jgi:hypothetical protein
LSAWLNLSRSSRKNREIRNFSTRARANLQSQRSCFSAVARAIYGVREKEGGCVQLRWSVGLVALVMACASSAKTTPPVRHVAPRPRPAPAQETIAQREAKADERVNVRGIEGSLSSFDVRMAMEKRGAQFGACHAPRARRLPRLAGRIEFFIRVSPEGTAEQVDVRSSDVGDRELERCFVDVIQAAPFPRPNGGEAKVSWVMELGPARAGKDPEQWEEQRVGRAVAKHGPDLVESCALPGAGSFVVTAYVNSRGRVVTAGVAHAEGGAPELLDCIADALRSWQMPTPKKSRLAKVSFALAPGQI